MQCFEPPDRDQTLGLDEADNSPREQGTLFLPPSLAFAVRPLPSTRTLLTVCAPLSAVGFRTLAHRGNHPEGVLIWHGCVAVRRYSSGVQGHIRHQLTFWL